MDNDQLAEDEFCVFISPIYGIRALAKLLKNSYYDRYNLHTVGEIIDRFAPPVENLTNSYISHVAESLNVGADDEIDLADPLTLHLMIEAIIEHENGGKHGIHYYQIADGMVLAAL
jgi:hypothetical protein